MWCEGREPSVRELAALVPVTLPRAGVTASRCTASMV